MSGGVGEFSRVERVDRVETFLSVSSPHSLIIYSRSSTEGSDTFSHVESEDVQQFSKWSYVCHSRV